MTPRVTFSDAPAASVTYIPPPHPLSAVQFVKLQESSIIEFDPVEVRLAEMAPPLDAAVQEEKDECPATENAEPDVREVYIAPPVEEEHDVNVEVPEMEREALNVSET